MLEVGYGRPIPYKPSRGKVEPHTMFDLRGLPDSHPTYLYSYRDAGYRRGRDTHSRAPLGPNVLVIYRRHQPKNFIRFPTERLDLEGEPVEPDSREIHTGEWMDRVDLRHAPASELFVDEMAPVHAFDRTRLLSRYHASTLGPPRPFENGHYPTYRYPDRAFIQSVISPQKYVLPIRDQHVQSANQVQARITGPSLLDLPPEIRLLIFHHLIRSGCLFHVLVRNRRAQDHRQGRRQYVRATVTTAYHVDNVVDTDTAIVSVCKSISHEAHSILYGENRFLMHIGADLLGGADIHAQRRDDIKAISSTFCSKQTKETSWHSPLWPLAKRAVPYLTYLHLTINIVGDLPRPRYTDMLSKTESIAKHLRSAKSLRDLTIVFYDFSEAEMIQSTEVYNVVVSVPTKILTASPVVPIYADTKSRGIKHQYVLEPFASLYGIPSVIISGALTETFAKQLTSVMTAQRQINLPLRSEQQQPEVRRLRSATKREIQGKSTETKESLTAPKLIWEMAPWQPGEDEN